ncbi:DUF3226 domain-containing protein [Pseudomonas triticifolii]|uniref:DUF4435 domain-containing protein n=1 Tax=Pseudomonas triticifolii TaxID=2762592 RepID=A0ABR7BKE9_9PSED|nr:DUF3226 domain-containing protein [Pseudomonas triticifolii]MBC3957669.1 hypothetical protein [Pseudomonas triticifolii]
MSTIKHKGPNVLLVEGKNDAHLVFALCEYFKLPDFFGIYDCESDLKVMQRLNALLAGSEPLHKVGVILDADAPSLSSKWQSVSSLLSNSGYIVPQRPEKNGTILTAVDRPVIGIWLMPDNEIDGMLEDFCMRLAPQSSIDFAQKCVREAAADGHTSFTSTHAAKAAIHTFLAWQDEPGMPLGLAVKARALDPTQPIALLFKDFLVALFDRS